MADPKFVQLRDELVTGIVCDVDDYGTGWSISGLDVKEFPEDEREQQFVRDKLARGVLVEGNQAAFEAIHGAYDRVAESRPVREQGEQLSSWQENKIQAAAKAARQDLLQTRRDGVLRQQPRGDVFGNAPAPILPDEEVDKERRQAIIEQAKEQEKGGGKAATAGKQAKSKDDGS